jgi:glucose-1-phosphate thymidylyltransferase
VAFGFPDNIFQPDDAFVRLLDRQSESRSDIVLGLFPTHQPNKVDMVDLDPDGRICGIQIKPARTHLRYTWLIAVWAPEFTRFMHEYVTVFQKKKDDRKVGENVEEDQELFVGNIIQAAINNDMQVDTVLFPNGKYLDIGTPEDIIKAFQSNI